MGKASQGSPSTNFGNWNGGTECCPFFTSIVNYGMCFFLLFVILRSKNIYVYFQYFSHGMNRNVNVSPYFSWWLRWCNEWSSPNKYINIPETPQNNSVHWCVVGAPLKPVCGCPSQSLKLGWVCIPLKCIVYGINMPTGLNLWGSMGLSENSVPLHPMVLLIIIPTKWL